MSDGNLISGMWVGHLKERKHSVNSFLDETKPLLMLPKQFL